MSPLPLQGFVVGITADRRAHEQAELLARRGARVLHGPTICMLPLGPDDGLRQATSALIARPPDVLLANTGVGIRTWLAAAESWGMDVALLQALRGARVLSRGPKASGALLTAGVEVDWQAPSERFAGVVERVLESEVSGTRVAIQLDGGLVLPDESLAAHGCDVVPVEVYRWTLPRDVGPARRLIERACAGRVDAVTFTSAPSVRNLLALAAGDGLRDDLLAAFADQVVPMCVGPVCREAAVAAGLERAVEPGRARMGAMVAALAETLRLARRCYAIAGHDVAVQGSRLVVNGEDSSMTDRERDVLHALARRPGAVIAKRALLAEVWGAHHVDPHALEVAVARLRRRLGPAAEGLQTVIRRGYRLDAIPA